MLHSFYSAMGNRPQRLSEQTRTLAARALDAEFGLPLSVTPAVEMGDVLNFWKKQPMERYCLCVRRIVEQAPIRIISPLIAGSATFDRARAHALPAYYNGAHIFGSVSHLTPGFDRVLPIGFKGLREQIRQRLLTATSEETTYLNWLLHVLNSEGLFHQRTVAYIRMMTEKADGELKKQYERMLEALLHVPENPPRNFHEALQSLWFQFVFLRLLGNWPAIGRIDYMLGSYLERDLLAGVLTREDARELLAHFFIMGCEWITGDFVWETGDAQHYQNIVLGGTDADGKPVANIVTELVLEVVEELSVSDFPIAVRVAANTPNSLLCKMAEVTRHGGGVVAMYNDEVCVQSLVKAGIALEKARCFANDGCWEIQVPGETNFGYIPVDLMGLLNREVLRSTDPENADVPNFTETQQLLAAFQTACEKELCSIYPTIDERFFNRMPTPSIDLFTGGCIERAKGYYDDGPDYLNISFHAGGMADAANSIYAIQELCFLQKKLSCRELIPILRSNWVGQETLRQTVRNQITYFGNDNDEADAIFQQVYDMFVRTVNRCTQVGRVRVSPGISTFGREIEWSKHRGATAFGARAGEILATNVSPSPGTDHAGATALLRSSCKVDYTRLSGSTAVHLRLAPDSLRGEDGMQGLVGLYRGFIQEGGFFLQIDVANRDVFLQAQLNPDAYRNLSVRVSGWSARFVTLNKEWQDMIIAKNTQE